MKARQALLALLLGACGSASNPSKTVKIDAQVCGGLCGSREATDRAGGDFTGLACATHARIRIYAVTGSGTITAAPRAERCVELKGDTSLVDLFSVSAGVPNGVPVPTGMPVSLGTNEALGKFIAEVALYAPGSLACPSDGTFVALGRSAVTDVTTQSTMTVPLGCHASCDTSQPRGVQVKLEDLGGAARTSVPQSTIGELFAYDALFVTAGVCEVPVDTYVGTMSFRPFADGAVDGSGRAMVTYGLDASKFGGCIAVQVATGSTKTYACLDAADGASPTGYLVPDSHLAGVLGVTPLGGDTPTAGTLVVQVVDESGTPQQGVLVSSPGSIPSYVSDTWQFSSMTESTSALGLVVIPNALFGSYDALDSTFGRRGSVVLGGGALGTITTVRLVVKPIS